MIIAYPTGLYVSVLPKSPSDPGPVSWTISSNDPPRMKDTTIQLISFNRLQAPQPKSITPYELSTYLGDFIFNISTANANNTAIGSKIYEPGQLLDFGDAQDINVANPAVPPVIELQQNTNLIDYAALGLTPGQVTSFLQSANQKFLDLVSSINSAFANIQNVQNSIMDNNKLLSEVTKALGSAKVVYGSGIIIDALTAKQTEITSLIASLTSELDVLNTNYAGLYNELLALREVIR